jgi:catechol 2,3-dioxygenase-like lactoylglutathione lyase family enzyme
MSLLYKRITLCVADLERSLKIYRDILGFTINYIQPSEKDSFSYPVFNIPKEAKLNFATLDSPTQERTFALTEIKGVVLPKQEGIKMSASVIKVDDLKEVVSKVKALGLETTNIKTDSSDQYTFIEQAFVDFDGHLIVLYELLEKG